MSNNTQAIVLRIGYQRFMFTTNYHAEITDILRVMSVATPVDYSNIPSKEEVNAALEYVTIPNEVEVLNNRLAEMQQTNSRYYIEKNEAVKQLELANREIETLRSQLNTLPPVYED